jgi:lipid-binding SYLF domain-containing protein
MRPLALTLSLLLTSAAVASEATNERLNEAADLFAEVMGTPDRSIPQDLLQKAHCVVLVPSLKKAAFVFGGKYGRGFAACRKPTGPGWGAPAALRVEGGSFGFQIGASSTDVVLLVMNERGMKRLMSSKFTLGADASVAGGPVGRSASAQTDAMMAAEILSWSRSRGAFAGVSLEGATLRNDVDENREMYGRKLRSQDILLQNVTPPAAASKLLSVLNKYSARES